MTEESNREESRVQTFRAMLQTEPTEMDCQRCLAQLAAYVEMQVAQGDYRAQFLRTAQHLDGCGSCAEAYARVYEVELAEKNGRLPHPSHIPDPDLSFLSQALPLWATLRSALQQTQTRLTLQLDATLTALLVPPPSLALTRSAANASPEQGGSGRFGGPILSLTPGQVPETDLPFSLAAYADTENPAQCLVEITVEPPGLSWPHLGGSVVQLHVGEVVLREMTDDWGTAVFTHIPRAELEKLRLEIQFQ